MSGVKTRHAKKVKIEDDEFLDALEETFEERRIKEEYNNAHNITYYLDLHNPEINAKQYIDNRLAIYKGIKNGDIQLSNCDMSNLIDIRKFPKPNSASDSIIILGNLKYNLNPFSTRRNSKDYYNDNIIIKLTFVPIQYDDSAFNNSLLMEIEIYKKTNFLLLGMITPHVMGYVTSFNCSTKELIKSFRVANDRSSNTILYNRTSEIKKIKEDDRKVYSDEASVLIIERGIGSSLEEAFINFSNEDWNIFIFQLCYTLQALYINGIQHNDLHIGNVWVQPITKTKITYNIGRNSYTFDTKFIIKIFDYDFGFIDNRGLRSVDAGYDTRICDNNVICHNTKLDDFCDVDGICNILNPKFDLFTNLSIIYHEIAGPSASYIRSTIEKIISTRLLRVAKTGFGFKYRLCNVVITDDGGHHCEGFYIPSDSLMLGPLSAIQKLYEPDSHFSERAGAKFTFTLKEI
jgi:hypothetical protein